MVTVTSDAVAAGSSLAGRVAEVDARAAVASQHDLEMQIAVHQHEAAEVRVVIAVRHGLARGGGRRGRALDRRRRRDVRAVTAGRCSSAAREAGARAAPRAARRWPRSHSYLSASIGSSRDARRAG